MTQTEVIKKEMVNCLNYLLGKFGLKYAKISNRQRQALIERVTSTGCTIKSAAKDLSINFSTAKAIMQIFRREGRITKKIVREIKQKTNKNLG